MLRRRNGNDERFIRQLRGDVAQLWTDVQRLWRLQSRVLHEPQEVIGGYAGPDSSLPSSGGTPTLPYPSPSTWPYPDPDNSSSPGSGPGAGGVGDDCCLWVWDGLQWIKVIDNTDGCECPEPEDDGTEVNETTVTCCAGCTVTCGARELSCTLELTYSNVGAADEFRDALAGTYTLTWNGVDAWVSDCKALASVLGIFNSCKVSVPCPAGPGGAAYTYASFSLYLTGNCTGGSASQGYGPMNETSDAPWTFECNDVVGCVDVQIVITEA